MKKFNALFPAVLMILMAVNCHALSNDSKIRSKKEIILEAKQFVPTISPLELHDKKGSDNKITILDVRTEREHNSGYIGKSIWIPRGVLEFKIQEVCKSPGNPIVVYCRKGGRSLLAALTLKKMGYLNVFNLKGGINAWGEKGYPLYNWHGEIKVTEFDKKDPDLKNYDIFKK